MTVKALKKQLMAAIAMVVVSAIALSSSTYAWFASNNVVKATGMSVKATTEGGIEIKVISATQALGNEKTTGWATTANANIAAIDLLPTSNKPEASAGVITSDWYHASAAVATAATAKPDTYCKLQTVTDSCTFTNGVESGNGMLSYENGVKGAVSAGAYYLATSYDIASVGAGATDLKVQGVTVTGVVNSGAFDESLRVAIVCGSNVALYAPVGYTADTSYKVITATTGTPMALAAAANTTVPETENVTAMPSTSTSEILIGTVGDENSPTRVNVYIWYEGEDTNHFTNNATNVDGLSVTVDFVATLN